MSDGPIKDMQRHLRTIRRIYYTHDPQPALTLSYATARRSILESIAHVRETEKTYNQAFFPNYAKMLYGTTTEDEA